jgi:HAE1 family hydrophobic/amphiphilic exporter-1
MFVLALVTMGYLSRSRMPQELNPKIDFPMVTVSTVYAGAGPNEIESLVTEPIEKAVSSIGHLKDVTSISQDSVSNVMLEFELGTDLEAAAADIRDKVSSIQSQLPKDADKSRILKLDISAQPIMTIGLAGPLSPRDMRILADDVVSERLAKVGGVAGVSVLGGQQRELSVAVDKERLDAYGLGIGSVADALRSANMNLPAGSVQEESRNYSVRTVGSYTSLRDIKDALIALPGGPGSIHVSDVAKVTDTVAEPNIIVCRYSHLMPSWNIPVAPPAGGRDGNVLVQLTVRRWP